MKLFQNKTLSILLILVLGFCAYSFIFPAAFKTMDDAYSIVNNEQIRSFANIPDIFLSSFFGSSAYYRPLVSLSFMLEYHFFALQPDFYYLVNILLHLLNAVLVYLLIETIIGDRRSSFFVGLLYAIHPVQWEAVTNIPGRSILLCAFFYFLSLYAFTRARDGGLWYCIVSLISFVLALFSKESAGVLPLVMTSYVFFVEKDRVFKSLAKRVSPYYIVALAYVVWRKSLAMTGMYTWRNVQECIFGFLSFLRSLGTHLRTVVLPYDLHFDRMQRVFGGLADVEAVATLICFVLCVVFLIRSRKGIPATMMFFITWFCIDLLPVSQILVSIGVQPGYIMASDHFLYLPLVALLSVVVISIDSLLTVNVALKKISRKVAMVIVVVVLGVYYTATVRQVVVSKDEMAMYQQTLRHNPQNTRIRSSLGLAYAQQGNIDEAQRQFQEVLQTDPQHARARIGLGKTFCDQKKLVQCVQEYEKVRAVGKLSELLKENMRETYNVLIEQYNKLIREDPTNAQAYYSLGVAYQRNGRLLDAIEMYHNAVLIEPNYKNALFNLAGSYRGLGRDEKALVYFEKLLKVSQTKDNLDLEAYRQLAAIYEKQGDAKNTLYYQTLADKFIKSLKIQ